VSFVSARSRCRWERRNPLAVCHLSSLATQLGIIIAAGALLQSLARPAARRISRISCSSSSSSKAARSTDNIRRPPVPSRAAAAAAAGQYDCWC